MALALPSTLSTLQLVCHLVAPGNSGIGTTTSGTIELLTSTADLTLPPGYIAYPDFNVAYKVHNERVTWDVAKERCSQEGAHLAVIDSFEKIELIKKKTVAEDRFVHVGFHSKDDDDSTWYSVSTGLPVSNLPWSSGEPSGRGHCAEIRPASNIGLGSYSCRDLEIYMCEISFP